MKFPQLKLKFTKGSASFQNSNPESNRENFQNSFEVQLIFNKG